MGKPFLASATVAELQEWCKAEKLPPFRAGQIRRWVTDKLTLDPDAMSNIGAELRSRLKESFHAPGAEIVQSDRSPDGVEKLLLRLQDSETIEMVIIPASDGRITFCLSTQVGCPVGCLFCASGRGGLVRNLTTGEILEEFLLGCGRIGRRCDNIVFMGIGEGMLNTNELFPALEQLSSPEGFAFAPRRITVSTSGYIPGMERFAELKREYGLAVSLHAPDDETRAKLIPDPLRFPVAEILAAADRCSEASGRFITLEYTLISGINDSVEQGHALGKLAYAHHAKVNLIPYNSTGTKFRRPSPESIKAFELAVAAEHAMVTRRMERGSSKTAACGQLRRREAEKKSGC